LPDEFELDVLYPAVHALVSTWQAVGQPGAIIGAVAVSLRSQPRSTTDVDAIIVEEKGRAAELAGQAREFGLELRSPDSLELAKRTRVLGLVHVDSGVRVDVWLGMFPFEIRAVERARPIVIRGKEVAVSVPEDLIVLKAFAGRLHDLADIETILTACPELDREDVERSLRRLAQDLESPEVWESVRDLPAWKGGAPPK